MPERERVRGLVRQRLQRAETGPGPRGGGLSRGAQTALVLGVGIFLMAAIFLSVFHPEPGPPGSSAEEVAQRQREAQFVEGIPTLHPRELERQLEEGMDPDARGEYRETALQRAVKMERADLVEILLERGADPNLVGASGRAPLTEAAVQGEPDITKLLLTHDADPDLVAKGRQEVYRRALELAVAGHHFETARVLLEGGAEWDIFVAAGLGDRERVEKALATGAQIERVDHRGRTALSWAAQGGHADMVAYLLEQGASAAEDSSQPPVLVRAIRGGSPEVARLLLEAGASPLPGSEGERSPLHDAAMYGEVELVRLLLDAGVPVDLKQVILPSLGGAGFTFREPGAQQYNTPLHEAAVGAHTEVVRLLLKRGADPNAGAAPKKEPLYRVAGGAAPLGGGPSPDEKERMEIARMLLEAGADPRAGSDEGASAAEAAEAAGHAKLAALLREAEAVPPGE